MITWGWENHFPVVNWWHIWCIKVSRFGRLKCPCWEWGKGHFLNSHNRTKVLTRVPGPCQDMTKNVPFLFYLFFIFLGNDRLPVACPMSSSYLFFFLVFLGCFSKKEFSNLFCMGRHLWIRHAEFTPSFRAICFVAPVNLSTSHYAPEYHVLMGL